MKRRSVLYFNASTLQLKSSPKKETLRHGHQLLGKSNIYIEWRSKVRCIVWIIQSSSLPWAATSSTSPGCSKPCSAWASAVLRMRQPQPPWATYAGDSPPTLKANSSLCPIWICPFSTLNFCQLTATGLPKKSFSVFLQNLLDILEGFNRFSSPGWTRPTLSAFLHKRGVAAPDHLCGPPVDQL